MKTQVVVLLVAIVCGDALGAEYFIYRDSTGKIVVSNDKPPEGSTIVKRYDWRDATDAEIASTEKSNRELARELERKQELLRRQEPIVVYQTERTSSPVIQSVPSQTVIVEAPHRGYFRPRIQPHRTAPVRRSYERSKHFGQ